MLVQKHIQSDKINPKCRKSFIKSICEERQCHIKATPLMHSLHNLYVQLSGFHTLFDLKTAIVSEFLISLGQNSILCIYLKYLNEFFLLRTLFTDGITRSY